jgi:hypothetical protein
MAMRPSLMASAVVVARRENELSKAQPLPLENRSLGFSTHIYLSIYLSIYLMAEVVPWAVFNSAPTMIDGTMDDDES